MISKLWFSLPENKFVIYGNGTIAHLLYSVLKEKKKENTVAAFIVSQQEEGVDSTNCFMGIPIRTVDTLKGEYTDHPVLIGVENVKAKKEIVEKLTSMGISNYFFPKKAIINVCYAYQKKCRKKKICSLLGWKRGLFYRVIYDAHKKHYIKWIGKRTVTFRLFNKYKLYMRLFSRDLDFFESIYIGEWNSEENKYIGEYDFEIKECDTVFDFGANIGLFTLKFAPFSRARFVSVEPEISNYKLLKRNVERLPNVRCVRNGVWYRDAYCKVFPGRTIVFPSNTPSEGSFHIGECQENTEGAVRGLPIASWLKKYGSRRCVIKMDVEGAEKEIFEQGDLGWIDHCVQLIIEIHSKHTADPLLRDKIIRIMSEHSFKWFAQGENIIFER